MNVCTPLEFLQQAKSIVQRHEHLKIAAASLQQTLAFLESNPVCHDRCRRFLSQFKCCHFNGLELFISLILSDLVKRHFIRTECMSAW